MRERPLGTVAKSRDGLRRYLMEQQARNTHPEVRDTVLIYEGETWATLKKLSPQAGNKNADVNYLANY